MGGQVTYNSPKGEHAGRPGAQAQHEVFDVLPDLLRDNATGTERIVPDDEWDNPSIRSNRRARRAKVARRGNSRRK